MPQECHWCFNCRMKFYRNERPNHTHFFRNHSYHLDLCSFCNKNFVPFHTFVHTGFENIYISKKEYLNWLGYRTDWKDSISFSILQAQIFRKPRPDKITKLWLLYNNKFIHFIRHLDRALQLNNYSKNINLTSVKRHLIYWQKNHERMKNIIHTARIIYENYPGNYDLSEITGKLYIIEFDEHISNLDNYLRSYSPFVEKEMETLLK